MKVSVFIPCYIDQLFPKTGISMVKVLEAVGCEVDYPKGQTCCGQPACNSGFQNEARAIAKKFVKDFSETDHYIVGPTGSCIGYVKNEFDNLLRDASIYNNYKSMRDRVWEFTDFLANKVKENNLNVTFNAKACYHDGCGSLRECGIKQAPRTLLEQVNGLELVEMKEAETCCGFGGTFAVKFEPISIGMAKNKVESALATGAEYIVSADMSCLMQINAYIQQQKINIKTIHIADLLATGL
ncbi:MAG TPA: (Fe-S)-binding protein [Edaphocola sp.]|nr:(Fe-S)-binding protein [Edaphocola sp.]